MATTLQKFVNLSETLPAQLSAVRRTLTAEAERDTARFAAQKTLWRFRWLWTPLLIMHLSLPFLVVASLASTISSTTAFEILLGWPTCLGIWSLFANLGEFGTAKASHSDFNDVKDAYPFVYSRDVGGASMFNGMGFIHYYQTARMGWFRAGIWILYATPHFLWVTNRFYRKRVQELGTNQLALDDRFPALNRLLQNLASWDQDVKLINRLIDQVDLGLIPEKDVLKHYERLRADEEFLKMNIIYVERLLKEGPLGTSTGLTENPVKAIEQVDERMQQIDANRKGLREFAMRLDAIAEVSRLK